MESFYAGAYWTARKETVEACTSRAVACLLGLAACDPLFSRWLKLGKSRKEALKNEVSISPEEIKALLIKGVNRRDANKEIIQELGMTVGLWTGGKNEEAASIMIHCGSYSTIVGNSCVIDLPYGEEAAKRILKIETLISIAEVMVRSWDPDWVTVSSWRLREKVLTLESAIPQVGWLTYISNRLGSISSVPPPAELIKIDETGNLLIATRERFSTEREEHVVIVNRLIQELLNHGILKEKAQSSRPLPVLQ